MDTTYQSNPEVFNSSSSAASAGTSAAMMVIMLVFVVAMLLVSVLMIVSMWKLFEKAGKPGWASIVPFYNTYVMVEIAGRPAWWFAIILLVPLLNVVFSIIVTIDFVKAYGKGTGYGVLSLFFPFITFPIMAFDKNVQYVAGSGVAAPVAPQTFAQTVGSFDTATTPPQPVVAPTPYTSEPAPAPVSYDQQPQTPEQPLPPRQ